MIIGKPLYLFMTWVDVKTYIIVFVIVAGTISMFLLITKFTEFIKGRSAGYVERNGI
jgi:hypothetical protein